MELEEGIGEEVKEGKVGNQMKHSEHPWHNCHGGNCKCGLLWDASGNVWIGEVYHPYRLSDGVEGPDAVPDEETFKANYKLITAAPDLLAACEALLDFHRQYDENTYGDGMPGNNLYRPWLLRIVEQAEAAVKRATEHDDGLRWLRIVD